MRTAEEIARETERLAWKRSVGREPKPIGWSRVERKGRCAEIERAARRDQEQAGRGRVNRRILGWPHFVGILGREFDSSEWFTREELVALKSRADAGDVDAFHRLARAGLRAAMKRAYRAHRVYELDADACVSAAHFGCLEAARKWKPEVRDFFCFVAVCVGGELLKINLRAYCREKAGIALRRANVAPERLAAPDPGPDRARQFEAIRRAIDDLPKDGRAVARLVYLEAKDGNETAARLGCGASAVRRRLDAAREALQATLRREECFQDELEGIDSRPPAPWRFLIESRDGSFTRRQRAARKRIVAQGRAA